MNIHLLIVHFPIAFLTFYAVAEIVPIRRLRTSIAWHHIKTVILGVGFASALLALATGDGAEQMVGRSQLTELHSSFAALSTVIFGVALLIYLIIFINKFWGLVIFERFGIGEAGVGRMLVQVVDVATKIQRSWCMALLALVGLCAITITGALGGAIAYGPEIDPFVKFIYSLFF